MHVARILSSTDRRKLRNRMKVRQSGRVRLCISRTNKHIYAQIVNDQQGKTLAAVHDIQIKKTKGLTKTDIAREVGKLIADKAQKAGVKTVVFDRGSYAYHGRVKAVADAAREGGLQF